jgi:hypothetical protein
MAGFDITDARRPTFPASSPSCHAVRETFSIWSEMKPPLTSEGPGLRREPAPASVIVAVDRASQRTCRLWQLALRDFPAM